jgi:transaldolase/glucose-6-phosphate isomerase
VTAGFGPRFQHSTGQFHKGGPNTGWFIQVVYAAENDFEIPTQGMTFGTLIRAQALGDYEALVAAGRRVLRIYLSSLTDLGTLVKLLDKEK